MQLGQLVKAMLCRRGWCGTAVQGSGGSAGQRGRWAPDARPAGGGAPGPAAAPAVQARPESLQRPVGIPAAAGRRRGVPGVPLHQHAAAAACTTLPVWELSVQTNNRGNMYLPPGEPLVQRHISCTTELALVRGDMAGRHLSTGRHRQIRMPTTTSTSSMHPERGKCSAGAQKVQGQGQEPRGRVHPGCS